MFIFSFKVKGFKIAGWIVLLIFLIVGGFWFFNEPKENSVPQNVEYREEAKAWQV